MLVRQQLRAENDVNGNPRRVWILYDCDNGIVVACRDEGYEGDPIHNDESLFSQATAKLPSIDVEVSEYEKWVEYDEQFGERRGELVHD